MAMIVIGIIVLLVIALVIYLTVSSQRSQSAQVGVSQQTGSVPAAPVVQTQPVTGTVVPPVAAPVAVKTGSYYDARGCFTYKFSNDLSLGSTGADVVALQGFLMANGYAIPGIADGSSPKGTLGSQTLAALRNYQQSVGLAPNGQYAFDIVTRSYINSLCGKTASTPINGVVLSIDPTTPVANTVHVSNVSNGQYLGLSVLAFDLNPQNAAAALRKVVVTMALSGSGQATVAYLYQGTVKVASAPVVRGVATFSGFDPFVLPGNANTSFVFKADVSGVSTQLVVTASISAADITATNQSYGLAATVTGRAQGNPVTVTE